MAKTSVIIPSRNEKYLIPTIEDVFRNARGEVEVIAVLEGYYPENWKAVTDKYPNLHTIHHSEAQGMRPAINAAAASAISRGTKYLMKLDAHCSVGEGFDEILKADCDKDWVVVPRRKRLDPETWTLKDVGKPDIDYHYLSFPDDPSDFGGPGLNGKVWEQRIRERFGKPEYDIDDEMSSQGSGWFMHASYFQQLELMDDANYGKFWNEFQEIGLKCWLSGGQVKVNKKTHYAHWHKGKSGRGYKLPESWLKQGASFTKKWLFNEAWAKQTLPFKTLIERFWPVPSWPENWEELVYGNKELVSKKLVHDLHVRSSDVGSRNSNDSSNGSLSSSTSLLIIHSAYYGIGDTPETSVEVTDTLRSRVVNGSLDIVVTNSELGVGNPFRGQKKKLHVVYSCGGPPITIERDERDWLIIGQSGNLHSKEAAEFAANCEAITRPPVFGIKAMEVFGDTSNLKAIAEMVGKIGNAPEMRFSGPYGLSLPTATSALNDFIIRRFQIPDRRLRAPMPIELPNFHRDDLAALFAELGFNKGAEIGVAEGTYSEILLKANPQLELTLVDPWTRYSDNPRAHSEEHQQFSLNETKRKTQGYNVHIIQDYSMNAVMDVPPNSLDFVYIDGHHSFDYVVCDLIEWSKRVRSGGIIAGDDYYAMKWGGVVEAVQAYTNAHGIKQWFIFRGHKSVDFMWVKP